MGKGRWNERDRQTDRLHCSKKEGNGERKVERERQTDRQTDYTVQRKKGMGKGRWNETDRQTDRPRQKQRERESRQFATL